MTDLKIIQEVFGNNEVSEKWLINMFEVCRRIRAAEREACAKMCEQPWQGHFREVAAQIRARGQV